jgi:hypothetical protein
MSSGRLELWTNEHPDGMARRPDDWQGTEIFDLQTVLNLLEALLNSGISVQKHHYKEVILSNRMQPTLKLTNSPFGHSGTKIT